MTKEPQILLDEMFFVSGEIPRVTSYEKGFPGHKRRSEDGTSWEDDPLIMDERFLAAHVRGKGIVGSRHAHTPASSMSSSTLSPAFHRSLSMRLRAVST